MISLRFLVCVALLYAVTKTTAQCPDETDSVDFEDFQLTSRFAENEQDTIDADSLAKLAMSDDVIKERQSSGNNAPSTELQEYMNVAEAETAEDALAVEIKPYYHWTCPARWYSLRRFTRYYKGSYLNADGQRVYKFCWTYYPIWVSRCMTKGCQLWYDTANVWPVWDYRYRCFDVYRYISVWAICLEYTKENGFKWKGKSVIRIRVPRGCACRKYYPWDITVANTCPIPQ